MYNFRIKLHYHFILLIILFYLFIFSSCSDSAVNEQSVSKEQGTWVEFNNLEDFTVTIYSDPARQYIITTVGKKSSKKVTASPNITGVVFYLTFSIDIPNIQNVFIRYNAPDIITVIEENKTVKVPIPKLEYIDINLAYIIIKNDSNYSLSLQYGNTELSPLGGRPSIIVPEQSAVYEIIPGNVSGFSLRRNTTTPIAFPAGFSEFKKGIIYSFTYNEKGLSLTAQTSILQNIPPIAPINIQAIAVSNSSVIITWNEVFGATSYRIHRATGSPTALYNQIGISSSPSYTDTTISIGQTYYYKVSAASSTTNIGAQSSPVSINMSPSGLKMSENSTVSITLSWNEFNSVNGYNLYRSDSENGIYTKLNDEPVTTTIFKDTDLLPDTTYYYKVSGVIDEFESLQSEKISTSTLSSIPVNIRVNDKTTVSIMLTWNTLNGASGYNVYRSDSENGTYTKLNNNIITEIEYNDIGISPDTIHYYKVSSINNGVEGLLSDKIKCETLSSIPVNVKTSDKTTVSIFVIWNVLNGADGYNVYRSDSENGIYTKINSNMINKAEFIDTSLSPDTRYYYKVSSINSGVEGLKSVAISAETLSSIPLNVRITSATALVINLSWDAVNGASGYNVYSSESENGIYTKKNNNIITGNVFADTGLSMDTIYYYKVSSVNNSIEGIQSDPIFRATSSVPANVWVRTATSSSVYFTWSSISEASGYNVYRSTSENGTYSKINASLIDVAEFTNTGSFSDTIYYYKIGAVIGGIEGIQTKPVSSLGAIVPGTSLAAKFTWLSNNTNTGNNNVYFIEVDIDVNSTPISLAYSGRSGLTIILRGKDQIRTISLSSNGSLFTIGSGVTLVLDKNITLKGRSSNNNSLVRINSDGALIMNTGCIINENSSSVNGGGVYVNTNAAFIMNGGEVSGNSSNSSRDIFGGGVYMDNGTFTMNGGKITNNSVNGTSYYYAYGGGIFISGGNFIMNGGEISGNTTTNSYSTGYTRGGGVYLKGTGTFRMSGGVIYGSNAATGKNTSANSSSALYRESGTAQYGSLSSGSFIRTGDLNTTDTTIRIVNGVLQTN